MKRQNVKTTTMKARFRIKVNENPEVRCGKILIAKPFWPDEIYRRSVVLLLDHGPLASSGIILNKISNLSVHDALPEMDYNDPLFYGGPNNKKTVSYIHSNALIPDAFYLGNDLYFGGNYDYVCEMQKAGLLNLKEFHFSAGFVHWKPGELEQEQSENKWWVSEISKRELFLLPSDELWGDKLVDEEHVYGLFNSQPDPSLN